MKESPTPPEIPEPNDSASNKSLSKNLVIGREILSGSWTLVGRTIAQVRDGSAQVVSQSVSTIGSLGHSFLATTGMTRWLSMSARSDVDKQFDDKHFFLVPFALAPEGYAFATIRVLPADVAPLNDLPKRRFIHLPNAASRSMLVQLVVERTARDSRLETSTQNVSSVNQTLVGLADQLDQIDSKLFYGALALGTVVALINPVAGAVVAAKALAPSVLATLAKYGLRSVGNSLEASAIESKVNAAEADVLRQFSKGQTTEVINPILAKLSLAIRTNEQEFDPLFDEQRSDSGELANAELPERSWNKLTAQAITSVYSDVLSNESMHWKARLGPEDVRWLRTLG